MREVLFILVILLVLIGLTALRYRKQIAGILGLARALKDAKNAATDSGRIGRTKSPSVQLVNCAKCGVWVPQDKALKVRDGYFLCSESCRHATAV